MHKSKAKKKHPYVIHYLVYYCEMSCKRNLEKNPSARKASSIDQITTEVITNL